YTSHPLLIFSFASDRRDVTASSSSLFALAGLRGRSIREERLRPRLCGVVESTEEQIKTLLAKLAVAGEAESTTLAAELRVLLHSQLDSLREKASTVLRVLSDNDKSSNAA